MSSWYQGNGNNGYDYQGDAPEEAQGTVAALLSVSAEMKKIEKPTGTRDAPGRTCRHIALADPTVSNGMYWIDPNGGSSHDAIRVFCKMNAEKTMTCLQAATHVYPTQQRTFTEREMGYWAFASSFEQNREFNYNSLRSQIKSLQRQMDFGRQRLVVRCKDAVTIYDKANNSYDNALTLTGFDEEMLTARSKKSHRYTVLRDTCQERSQREGQTVIQVSGELMMKRLPVLDVGFVDTSGQYGLKVGRACFWAR